MTDEIPSDAVEMTYRLSDLYAISFRSWHRSLRTLLIIEVGWIAYAIGRRLFDGWTIWAAVRWIDWSLQFGGGIAILAFWVGVNPILDYFQMKRSGFLGPNRISLNDRGIWIGAPKAYSLVHWSAIRRVRESSERLFLFRALNTAVIVPRRAFSSDSEFKAFASETKERWDKRPQQ